MLASIQRSNRPGCQKFNSGQRDHPAMAHTPQPVDFIIGDNSPVEATQKT
jgi:hypothetical protein